MQIKTINRCHLRLVKMAIKKRERERKKRSVGKDVKNMEYLCTVGGNVSWFSHYGKQYGGSSEN